MIDLKEFFIGSKLTKLILGMNQGTDSAEDYAFGAVQGADHGFELHNSFGKVVHFKVSQFGSDFGLRVGEGSIIESLSRVYPPKLEDCSESTYIRETLNAEVKNVLFDNKSSDSADKYLSKIKFITENENFVLLAGEYLPDRDEVHLGSDEATMVIGDQAIHNYLGSILFME